MERFVLSGWPFCASIYYAIAPFSSVSRGRERGPREGRELATALPPHMPTSPLDNNRCIILSFLQRFTRACRGSPTRVIRINFVFKVENSDLDEHLLFLHARTRVRAKEKSQILILLKNYYMRRCITSCNVWSNFFEESFFEMKEF